MSTTRDMLNCVSQQSLPGAHRMPSLRIAEAPADHVQVTSAPAECTDGQFRGEV